MSKHHYTVNIPLPTDQAKFLVSVLGFLEAKNDKGLEAFLKEQTPAFRGPGIFKNIQTRIDRAIALYSSEGTRFDRKKNA